MAAASQHQHIIPLVPALTQAARLHSLPPAATTLMEATCPASSMRDTLPHRSTFHELVKAQVFVHTLIHIKVMLFASSTLAQTKSAPEASAGRNLLIIPLQPLMLDPRQTCDSQLHHLSFSLGPIHYSSLLLFVSLSAECAALL